MRNIASLVLFLALYGCQPETAIELSSSATPQSTNQGASIAASPTSWTMYQGGPTHNAVFPGSLLDASWIVQFREKINAGLGIDGDTLYTDSFDHNVYAPDVRTGRLTEGATL